MGNLPKNLYTRYESIRGSYYRIPIKLEELFCGINAENIVASKEFILYHLYCGGKGEVADIPWKEKFKESSKNVHAVSLYLLGLTFQEYISEVIEKDLAHFITRLDWYDYKYTWFLTCLYHDVASNIERGRIPANPSEQQKQLTYYLGDNNISYTIFNSKWCQNAYQPRLSESLVKNYFYYRASCGECDHGILGGYYLFDRLYKNYQKNTRDGRHTDGLTRRKSHLPHFAYICDAIICHNIWTRQSFDVPEDEKFKNEEDIETYKCFGLSPLIYRSKRERLKFEEYPLQFLLCLLDTIEPVKRFSEQSNEEERKAEEILKSIDVSICGKNHSCDKECDFRNFSVKISWRNSVNKWNGFELWKNGILKTQNWLDLAAKKIDQNGIVITF